MRRGAAYLIPIVLTLPVVHALTAGPLAAGDAQTIEACLETERAAQRSGYACIGRISARCMETPGGETTVGMVQCLNREMAVWDSMLNVQYQRLLGALSDKAAKQARQAQRLWLQMRDVDCRLAYEIFEGGTIARPTSARCLLDRTATRALQIRDWREMANFE